MKKYLLLIAGMLCLIAVRAQNSLRSVYSPDKSVKIVVGLTPKTGEPFYTAWFAGKPISSGKLGLKGKSADFSQGFSWKQTRTAGSDKNWKPIWGEVATIRDHKNELTM